MLCVCVCVCVCVCMASSAPIVAKCLLAAWECALPRLLQRSASTLTLCVTRRGSSGVSECACKGVQVRVQVGAWVWVQLQHVGRVVDLWLLWRWRSGLRLRFQLRCRLFLRSALGHFPWLLLGCVGKQLDKQTTKLKLSVSENRRKTAAAPSSSNRAIN